jgi:hypothetical protein
MSQPQLFVVRAVWQVTAKLQQRCRQVLQTFVTMDLHTVQRKQLLWQWCISTSWTVQEELVGGAKLPKPACPSCMLQQCYQCVGRSTYEYACVEA